jgi:hypothetical protein
LRAPRMMRYSPRQGRARRAHSFVSSGQS